MRIPGNCKQGAAPTGRRRARWSLRCAGRRATPLTRASRSAGPRASARFLALRGGRRLVAGVVSPHLADDPPLPVLEAGDDVDALTFFREVPAHEPAVARRHHPGLAREVVVEP